MLKKTLLLLSLLFINSCSNLECDANSKEVKYAKSLSQARLEQLHTDVGNLIQSGIVLRRIPYDSTEVPYSFQDLTFDNILVSEDRSRLMLKSCFDHFITIEIRGFVEGEESEILLQFGEGPYSTEAVLWPKTKKSS